MNRRNNFALWYINTFHKINQLILIVVTFLLFISSCSTGYRISSVEGKYIQVVTTSHPDSTTIQLLSSYRDQLEDIMDEVIGHANTDLIIGKPESTLTNFTSDIMLTLDTQYTGGQPADFSLMNTHGHRANIRKGDITVGDIYTTYSFENELVILTLKGEQVQEVFEAYARMGGGGISHTVKLYIKDKKVVKALIHGKPINPEKVYTIVTIDYLAEGNNGMQALTQALSVTPVNITLRDHILNYIRNATAKGEEISSATDQRIIIK